MIKTIAKGRRIEDKAKKILEASGYVVDRKPRLSFRATYSPDLFKLFDLIAMSEYKLKFIQVKSSTTPGRKAAKEIGEWLREHGLNASRIDYEVWIYIGRKLKRKRNIVWRKISVYCDGSTHEWDSEQ